MFLLDCAKKWGLSPTSFNSLVGSGRVAPLTRCPHSLPSQQAGYLRVGARHMPLVADLGAVGFVEVEPSSEQAQSAETHGEEHELHRPPSTARDEEE